MNHSDGADGLARVGAARRAMPSHRARVATTPTGPYAPPKALFFCPVTSSPILPDTEHRVAMRSSSRNKITGSEWFIISRKRSRNIRFNRVTGFCDLTVQKGCANIPNKWTDVLGGRLKIKPLLCYQSSKALADGVTPIVHTA